MKEKPILFTGEMVKAILDGKKTQTRRLIKTKNGNQVIRNGYFIELSDSGLIWKPVGGQPWEPFPQSRFGEFCPYGAIGDRLWVKETWKPDEPDIISGYTYKADGAFIPIKDNEQAEWISLRKLEEQWPKLEPPKWRSPLFMPRWVSRITLEVTNIRVQRVQDISEEDAIAEGIQKFDYGLDSYALAQGREVTEYFYGTQRLAPSCMERRPVEAFRRLWDSINKAKCPWDSNPWVWVVDFKQVEREQKNEAND